MRHLSRRGLLLRGAGLATAPLWTLLVEAQDAAGRSEAFARPDVIGRLDARRFGLDANAPDNGPALAKALQAASRSGMTLVIPAGRYLFDSFDGDATQKFCVLLRDPNLNLDVECQGELAFGPKAGATDSIGAMIRIETPGMKSSRTRFRWSGGTFDLSGATQSERGLGALSLGPKIWSAVLRDVRFDGGLKPRSDGFPGGGGDQYLFAKETEFLMVEACEFYGAIDAAIYINGDDDPARYGARGIIQNCRFARCGAAIASKRNFDQLMVSGCFIEDGSSGVLFGATDKSRSNNGRRAIITGNVIRRMQGNPIEARNTDYVSITANTILDYRRLVAAPERAQNVRQGNLGGAVKLTGASQCQVVGNLMGFDRWTANEDEAREAVGVAILADSRSDEKTPSSFNLVANNVIRNTRRAVYVGPECRFNTIGPNRSDGVALPSVYAAPDLSVYDEGQFDPSIAGGGRGSTSQGFWRRAGSFVDVTVDISGGLDADAGSAKVAGLPFKAAAAPALEILDARIETVAGAKLAAATIAAGDAAITLQDLPRVPILRATISGRYRAV